MLSDVWSLCPPTDWPACPVCVSVTAQDCRAACPSLSICAPICTSTYLCLFVFWSRKKFTSQLRLVSTSTYPSGVCPLLPFSRFLIPCLTNASFVSFSPSLEASEITHETRCPEHGPQGHSQRESSRAGSPALPPHPRSSAPALFPGLPQEGLGCPWLYRGWSGPLMKGGHS